MNCGSNHNRMDEKNNSKLEEQNRPPTSSHKLARYTGWAKKTDCFSDLITL